jgi:hypothetical protein
VPMRANNEARVNGKSRVAAGVARQSTRRGNSRAVGRLGGGGREQDEGQSHRRPRISPRTSWPVVTSVNIRRVHVN